MLQKLSIRHFAIIDELTLEFKSGLNILSGETGAGKSILLQALALVMGGRGYAGLIRTGESECEVLVEFQVLTRQSVSAFLLKHGYPVEPRLTLHRILQRSGKGKVSINRQSATVAHLAELGRCLIDLVGQHASQSLLSEEMPRIFLDSFGAYTSTLEEYALQYADYLQKKQALEKLKAEFIQAREQEDLLRFQLKEIEEAHLREAEEEELAQERKILLNTSKITEAMSAAESVLYSGEGSVTELLGRVCQTLSRLSGIDTKIEHQKEQLHSYTQEIEASARFFQSYLEGIHFDPERLDFIESRLDQISTLQKKYGGSVESILAKGRELEKKIGLLDHFDATIAEAQFAQEAAQKTLLLKAQVLTAARQKSARELSKRMEKELASLSMKNTRFQVEVRPVGDSVPVFLPTGVDHVEFLISPNLGETPKPLALIVSGGELSRILLALKGVTMHAQAVPTYIFDEVDSGIGGAVAQGVGEKLKKIAKTSQVICITHLPQIAAFADVHFQILKTDQGKRTVTQVIALSDHEREEEIARMLAGVQVTEQARQNARELISQAKSLLSY